MTSAITSDAMEKELADAKAKLKSARAAAAAPDASERDKSDLKLIEQDYMALENQRKRDAAAAAKGAGADARKKVDRQLDRALEETFPGSDPVSFVQAAPLKEADATLTSGEASRGPNAGKDRTGGDG